MEENGQKIYAEEFCYDGRVYIFGGGHLAQELVPVLSHLGFWCMVLDDREEYTDHALFPGVQETKTVDFTALSQILEVKPEDYLVVVTRGHRCDADVERFALRTPASYIGVVGSKRKTRYVREKLASEGFTEEELDQVYAPIGIEIGSENTGRDRNQHRSTADTGPRRQNRNEEKERIKKNEEKKCKYVTCNSYGSVSAYRMRL